MSKSVTRRRALSEIKSAHKRLSALIGDRKAVTKSSTPEPVDSTYDGSVFLSCEDGSNADFFSPKFGADNKYLIALRNVLKETVGDQYDYIDWWLYEATDDYEVWEADKPLKYCIKEAEDLYDYITGVMQPTPVEK